MTKTQAEILLELANHDLSIQQTAHKLFRSHSGLTYHLQMIQKETGKNPLCFYDMCELLPIARAVLEEE